MASHYKWYPSSEEVVVPWNARYAFPSQANKAVKMTPRIPPKNGGPFYPGGVIRLEFPAQGYVNTQNTTLEFDVTLTGWSDSTDTSVTRFQNNIQSIFSRARLLYGATPLEDIINYNVIVRALTEWTATNQEGCMDQTSVAEGIGGTVFGVGGDDSTRPVNARQTYIQGIDFTATTGAGYVPNRLDQNDSNANKACTRRYQINFAFGLFTQDKLLPTKFMASQLAIELSLANAASCIFTQPVTALTGTNPSYIVSDVNLIPEILEFDASYDAMFLKGLREGGVPIKFSSWHTYNFSSIQATSLNLLIQERSRSVKAIFAVQRASPEVITKDSGALVFSSSNDGTADGGGTLQQFQFRIGGRYFPSAPVQCSTQVGSAYSNGGAEAYVELAKALNIVGDYRLSTGVNALRWALPYQTITQGGTTALPVGEADYSIDVKSYGKGGTPVVAATSGRSSNVGSSVFGMAVNLETSSGVEISGLNAEEQSDIALIAQYSTAQAAGYAMDVYTYYDAMVLPY
jgi:hypothetical protein